LRQLLGTCTRGRLNAHALHHCHQIRSRASGDCTEDRLPLRHGETVRGTR
jgi:hypothetical protein